MKRLKSTWLFAGLACLCALSLVLVGCGGSGSSAQDATTAEVADEAAAEEGATAEETVSTGEAATGYTTVTEGKLIVASDLDFPPLDSFEGGKAQGFDVELSEAIAEKLGLECEYLPPMDFDAIIPLIQQGGKADIGNSAFSITDERKEQIDFTDAYLDSNLGVAVKKDAGIPTGDEAALIEALDTADKTVAVQAGTTGEQWAKENLSNATIVPLASVTVCMTGVSTGKYDAFCADLPVIGHQCTVSFTDCEIALEIPTGEQYGIVVSKENPGLTAAINEALAELESDGTMAKLQEKWFGTTD